MWPKHSIHITLKLSPEYITVTSLCKNKKKKILVLFKYGISFVHYNYNQYNMFSRKLYSRTSNTGHPNFLGH